ncbi:MAG: GNAT family N-acetyltransferase, partial [Deinococcus sp.]
AGLGSDPALITATLEGCSYWLAIQDGTAIGCVGLEHGPVSAGGGASLLRSACVRPGWRGRGVGKRLAATALSAARERGDRAVYLFSSHAGAYWQRLGFLPMGVAEPRARGWIHAESAWKLDLPR